MERDHIGIHDWWKLGITECVQMLSYLLLWACTDQISSSLHLVPRSTSTHHSRLCTYSGGPKAAFNSAIACGILLGVFEGVGVLINRTFSEVNRPMLPPSKSSGSITLNNPGTYRSIHIVPEPQAPPVAVTA